MNNEVATKLEDFFGKYKTLTFRKGETILRSEDTPQGIFYVKSGFVKMNTIFENGKELTLNVFKPRSYFPMMWAIADIPNSYNYLAMAETELQRAPKEEVVKFIKENPDVLMELTGRILVGLNGILINMEHLLSGDAYHRVIAAIILSAKRFGENSEDGKIVIKLPMTHQDIANLAGITRETASIIISKLEKRKLISQNRHLLTINNIETFEEESLLDKREERLPEAL